MRALPAAAALAATLAGASPAFAQDLPSVISPLKVEMDHNNVNISDGKTTIDGPALSAPGASNLRFDRVQNAAPYVKANYSVGDPDTATSSHSIHSGRIGSESFKCTGTSCESVTWSGSTFDLAARNFREHGSGALWRFNLKHYDTRNTSDTTPDSQYYASFVEYPNGETISYSYGTGSLPGDTLNRTFYRPVTLSSNLGYSISISYQNTGTDVSQAGWGSPAVATLYKSGDSAPIGRLTYSGGTVTDLGGRQYVCGGCSNALGSPLQTTAGSLQLPNEGSPTLQVAQHGSGNVVGSVTRDGVGWTYSYTNLRLNAHASGYLYDKLTVNGPNGFQAVYDLVVRQLVLGGTQFNILSKSTDSLGRATSYSFDIATRPTKAVFPELNEVSVIYDGHGNVISKTTKPKPNSGLASIVETAYFDEAKCNSNPVMCYRPDYVRDGLGRQTDFVYNARGQVIEKTDPADQNGTRNRIYVNYDESTGVSRKSVVRLCGIGTTCGTNQEIRTEYLYWGNTQLPSRERRIDAYFGRTRDTHFTYDAAGRLLSKDGPLPGNADATYSRYDVHGRKTWEIGPLYEHRIATRFTYRDSDDKPIYSETGTLPSETSEALSVFSRSDFAYDARRNPSRASVSASGTTHKVTDTSYDEQGRMVCTAIRMNPAAFAAIPGACALGAQGSQGPDRITRNEYDAAGQLFKVQKAFGTPIQQDYAKYEYTLNGQRKAVIDANGNRAEMTWDGFDRQKRWIFPSNTPGYANPGDYEEYGYDAVGNRTSLRKRDGSTLTYAYDNLNRVITKIVPERAGLTAAQTRDVYYDYNNAMGLQTKARFDNLDGEGVTTYYDAFGQRTTVLLNMAGHARYTSYYHDDAGNLWRLTHPDNANIYHSYDALGRTTAVLDGPSTSIDDYVIRYWYNPTGARSGAVRGAGTVGFTTNFYYDAALRPDVIANDLPVAGADVSFSFAYNPANQITQRTASNDAYAAPPAYNVSRGYSVNGLNQYTAAGPASFSYDANGNLTSDGTTSYTYDVENRLVSASNGAGLVYDPLGRLWQTAGGAAGTTHFNYDGDRMIAEYNSSGTMLRRYVHGQGADEPVAVYEGAALGVAGRRYTLPDERGSVAALIHASGVPSVINRYDAWGIPSAGNDGRFQYTGQAWIPELGMYYYKARFYSPTLGRFLQTDPIGYEGDVNLYAYVANDPVNNTDPDGQQSESVMDRRYVYPRLNPEQVAGLEEQHYEIGRQAFTGMAIGASLVLAPELLVVRGGAFLAGRIASSSFTRAFSVAERVTGSLQRTGGSSGQRTWQGFANGGRAAAQRLFNGLTRGESVASGGGRLGVLRDGSTVQMSTRTLRDGTIRTDVRISREVTPTGSRIPRTENIKLRFDERP